MMPGLMNWASESGGELRNEWSKLFEILLFNQLISNIYKKAITFQLGSVSMCQFINNLWHWAGNWGPGCTREYETQPLLPSNFRYGFSWLYLQILEELMSWQDHLWLSYFELAITNQMNWVLLLVWVWECEKKNLVWRIFSPQNLV